MSEGKKEILLGDCLELLKELPENSVDAIVTDPPYGLEFMGKDWDKGVPGVHFWEEMIRVLKPGGHLLAFSGTRTYHRMAVAIEDAGFEVRDMIEWVYGSGFPKSLNIGKAVDKLQGNERETYLAPIAYPDSDCWGTPNKNISGNNWGVVGADDSGKGKGQGKAGMTPRTKGTSEYEGWGTALKPAHEPICMARKPLAEKTVAENCLKWGTGGINIDESRVGTEERYNAPAGNKAGGNSLNMSAVGMPQDVDGTTAIGRFPANLIHDNSEEVRECFPETKTGSIKPYTRQSKGQTVKYNNDTITGNHTGDSGNASRFFKSIIYQAKASKSERNKGCEGLEEKERIDYGGFHSEKGLIENNRNPENRKPTTNNHPTVKPIALMEYLIKMVTPKGGIVLDPFGGSGTTAVACLNAGMQFIVMEMQPEYVEIIKARIGYFNKNFEQQTLFGNEM